ncbi:DUF6059 family protein [Streptomyces sp. NPDC051921]|uniref:DUF6059 family protein n=1 Tax=Streptomyces sp. NPDC051921 TaxID=3155806 RepID=UPI0034140E87
MTGRWAARTVMALAARCWFSVLRALVSYGSLWTHRPADPLWPEEPRRVARPPARPGAGEGDGPPPGHPERLTPDVPLSGAERELLRRLLGP